MTDTDKIMGIIPKTRYMHFAYLFIILSVIGNVLLTVLTIIGIAPDSMGPAMMIIGVLGFVLALLGHFKFKDQFTAHDDAHFVYAAVMYGAFFVICLLLGGVYGVSPFLSHLLIVAISLAFGALIFTGLSSWQDGRVVTKENYKEEMRIALQKR